MFLYVDDVVLMNDNTEIDMTDSWSYLIACFFSEIGNKVRKVEVWVNIDDSNTHYTRPVIETVL